MALGGDVIAAGQDGNCSMMRFRQQSPKEGRSTAPKDGWWKIPAHCTCYSFSLWKLIKRAVLSADISRCCFGRIWRAGKCQEERSEKPEWRWWRCSPDEGQDRADIGGQSRRGEVRPQPSGPTAEVCAVQFWHEASSDRGNRRLCESVGGELCLAEPRVTWADCYLLTWVIYSLLSILPWKRSWTSKLIKMK